MKPQTIVLGYEQLGKNLIPIVACVKRTDISFGLKFYCNHCRKYHLHGSGNGHREAHCNKRNSPYEETGYILQEVEDGSI